MKKLFISALAATLALVGCQKEISTEVSAPEGQTVTFIAEQETASRTSMAVSNGTVNYSWTSEDEGEGKFNIFSGTTPATKVTSKKVGDKLYISATFDTPISTSSEKVTFTGYLNGEIPSSQTMGVKTYDPKADVLIARATTDAATLADPNATVAFQFKRMVAVAAFRLNGLTGTATEVTVSSNKDILGTTDNIGTWTPTSGSITVKGIGEDNTVYLTCAPVENADFSISAKVGNIIYEGAVSAVTLTAGNVKGKIVSMNSVSIIKELLTESFDTNDGTGGNDGQWSGSIASNSIKSDNDGWTFENGSGANQCAKFGTGSKLGSATTSALGKACDATLTFKAAAWNGTSEKTTLKLSVIGGGTVTPATVTLIKGEWSTFTATLSGLTTDSKVKFEGSNASNNRFFLDEITISTAESLIPLVTIDEIYKKASDVNGTETTTKVTFNNWVVTGVSSDGKNVYVSDGDNGFIIFDNDAPMGFAQGDILSGTILCKIKLFNGSAELLNVNSTTDGIQIEKGGLIEPKSIDISTLSGKNTGVVLTYSEALFDGTHILKDGNSLQPYKGIYDFPALESGKNYDISGVYLQYGGKKEILPRSSEDISLSENQPDPVVDPVLLYTLDATNEKNKGTNNSYTSNGDITVEDISWNVTGNATMLPWRIGGKSITKVDREVYSKTAYPRALSSIDLTIGEASSITINSIKLVYSKNNDFSNATTISSSSVAANMTHTFAPVGGFPADCYYKFVFNVTVSGSSNKFIEFKKVEFYGVAE